MKMLINVAKLPRFQFIMDNQTDKLRFIEKLTSRFKDAEEILVVDPTGLTYNYFPQSVGQTKQEALSKTPLRIPKAIVEEYNVKAQEDWEVGDPAIDPDSTATLKLQLTYWIEKSVLGQEADFTEDDIINIIATHGEPELGKFVYSIVTNGKLDPTQPSVQKRFSTPRTDVGLKITEPADKILKIESLKPVDIVTAILEAVNGDAELDGEEALLFADELLLPVIHFKEGQVYEVKVAPWALDYFGTIYINVSQVTPEPSFPLQTLIGDSTIERETSVDVGFSVAWGNWNAEIETDVLEWACDVPDSVITIVDPLTSNSVRIKLPDTIMAGDVVTTTLTTDAGAVTFQTTITDVVDVP